MYIKSVLWRVAKCLSYIEEARCLKVHRSDDFGTFIQNAVKRAIRRAYAANNFYRDQKEAAVDFLATSDSNYTGNVQTAWENIGNDINVSAKEGLDDYERKQHTLWSDKERSHCISKEAG